MVVVSEIKAALDLFKDILQGVKALHNYDPELIAKLNELQGRILDFRQKEMELVGEIDGLKQQLANREMPFDHDLGAYYEVDAQGEKNFFCQRCLDADNKSCRLKEYPMGFHCRVCNNTFRTPAMEDEAEADSRKRMEESGLRRESKRTRPW